MSSEWWQEHLCCMDFVIFPESCLKSFVIHWASIMKRAREGEREVKKGHFFKEMFTFDNTIIKEEYQVMTWLAMYKLLLFSDIRVKHNVSYITMSELTYHANLDHDELKNIGLVYTLSLHEFLLIRFYKMLRYSSPAGLICGDACCNNTVLSGYNISYVIHTVSYS